MLSRCVDCSHRYVPRDGPCPACGSLRAEAAPVPPRGVVLGATELLATAAGWTAPHRLAFVELAAGARLLVIVDGPIPAVGSEVVVERRDERWHARTS